jgi:hypothetical protein
MTRALVVAIVFAALLAGCDNGPQEAGPVPTGSQPHGSVTAGGGGTASSSGSTSTSATRAPLCNDKTAEVKVESQQGAAGTIATTWRVTNTSSETCRSFGYPGMDFHAASGWLDVQVQRGGVDMINEPPAPVVVKPGESLYFVSTWGDVDTDEGPCKPFDRVKVTLPDNFTSARVDASGCVDPGLVNVGPVSDTPPSS